ncbi:MAG: hypothetical protein SFY96_13080 [Planctomycetota bacterium]|nr:hypothetical protein [Planctomycetota bacterium]
MLPAPPPAAAPARPLVSPPPPPRTHAAHTAPQADAPAVVESKPFASAPASPAHTGTPVAASWAKVVDAATTRRIKILVESVQLSELSDEHAIVTAESDLAAAVQGAAPEIEDLLRRVFGKPLRLKIAGDAAANRERISTLTTPITAANAKVPALAEHPLVKEAIELFNARIVGVQRRQTPPPA